MVSVVAVAMATAVSPAAADTYVLAGTAARNGIAPSARGNGDPNPKASRNPADPSRKSIAPTAMSQASNAGVGVLPGAG